MRIAVLQADSQKQKNELLVRCVQKAVKEKGRLSREQLTQIPYLQKRRLLIYFTHQTFSSHSFVYLKQRTLRPSTSTSSGILQRQISRASGHLGQKAQPAGISSKLGTIPLMTLSSFVSSSSSFGIHFIRPSVYGCSG